MEKNLIKKRIENLHRELDDYQEEHEDASWVLIADDGEGITVSIGGYAKGILLLMVKLIVTMAKDEDDPLEYAENIIGVLSDIVPKAIVFDQVTEDSNDKIADALNNLAKALKHGLDR